MNLFIKGFVIGIAKVIPGLSGAMLAVSFSIYDRLINAITCFFDNKRENFKFLLVVGSGILLAIVFFSKIIRYFLLNYYIGTMMLFIGLIVGGTYNYSKNIEFNIKNIIIFLLVILFVMIISFGNVSTNYILTGNFIDYIMFFIGGIVEIFSSIVPGISGTALFMLMGMYDNILMLFSNMLNFSFVISNMMLYISYGIGMMISFIVFSILISYLLKRYRRLFDTIVFGLSISSILLLIIMTFSNGLNFISLFMGIFMFLVGLYISLLSLK